MTKSESAVLELMLQPQYGHVAACLVSQGMPKGPHNHSYRPGFGAMVPKGCTWSPCWERALKEWGPEGLYFVGKGNRSKENFSGLVG